MAIHESLRVLRLNAGKVSVNNESGSRTYNSSRQPVLLTGAVQESLERSCRRSNDTDSTARYFYSHLIVDMRMTQVGRKPHSERFASGPPPWSTAPNALTVALRDRITRTYSPLDIPVLIGRSRVTQVARKDCVDASRPDRLTRKGSDLETHLHANGPPCIIWDVKATIANSSVEQKTRYGKSTLQLIYIHTCHSLFAHRDKLYSPSRQVYELLPDQSLKATTRVRTIQTRTTCYYYRRQAQIVACCIAQPWLLGKLSPTLQYQTTTASYLHLGTSTYKMLRTLWHTRSTNPPSYRPSNDIQFKSWLRQQQLSASQLCYLRCTGFA